MMDDIKEEIREFKLENSCEDSIDVDDNNYLKPSLHDQKVKLEKQATIFNLLLLNDFMGIWS